MPTFSVGQFPDVSGEAFDGGLFICLFAESSVDFMQEDIPHLAQLVVGQDQLGAPFFNLSNRKREVMIDQVQEHLM